MYSRHYSYIQDGLVARASRRPAGVHVRKSSSRVNVRNLRYCHNPIVYLRSSNLRSTREPYFS